MCTHTSRLIYTGGVYNSCAATPQTLTHTHKMFKRSHTDMSSQNGKEEEVPIHVPNEYGRDLEHKLCPRYRNFVRTLSTQTDPVGFIVQRVCDDRSFIRETFTIASTVLQQMDETTRATSTNVNLFASIDYNKMLYSKVYARILSLSADPECVRDVTIFTQLAGAFYAFRQANVSSGDMVSCRSFLWIGDMVKMDVEQRHIKVWELVQRPLHDAWIDTTRPLVDMVRRLLPDDFRIGVERFLHCFDYNEVFLCQSLCIEWEIGGRVLVKQHELLGAYLHHPASKHFSLHFNTLVCPNVTDAKRQASLVYMLTVLLNYDEYECCEVFWNALVATVGPGTIDSAWRELLRGDNNVDFSTPNKIAVRQLLLNAGVGVPSIECHYPGTIPDLVLIQCGKEGDVYADGCPANMMVLHTLYDLPFKTEDAFVGFKPPRDPCT